MREDSNVADFTLTCANKRGENWRCGADVQVEISNEIFDCFVKDRAQFSNGNPTHVLQTVIKWEHLTDPIYQPSPMFDFSKLLSPKESSNVTLVLGDKKLHVSKDVRDI
ncbi:hypothetical protein PENTCL1PPCAC_16349 [Pristionchus entomophagus]|uniref:Uncharacterized protein n=1 Tax=Pristionchus entomophagus TaxID=358040 RepID=A0AAV5TIQ6_9BILA|nr:hypothetical protein PENTCL1PPCAC_16349 [Pristionchus entomophagus]